MRGKHWRRFLIVLLAAVMGLGLLCGCKSRDVEGNFYTLTEAFTIGYLTHDDLENIVYFQNHRKDESNKDHFGKLDKKTEKTIRKAWAKQYNARINEVIIESYHGTYNGCVAVYFSMPATDALWTETVDGVDINYRDGNRIYVWKADENDEIKGTFYTLTEAFNHRFFTHGNVKAIAYYQNSWMGDRVDYPGRLHKKIEASIKGLWAKQHNLRIDEVIIDSYFGTYSGCVAVMFSQATGDAEWTETVDGVDIHYGNGNRIYVWRADKNSNTQDGEVQGSLSTLKEAYENGWLTKEDLMSIAYYHNGGRVFNEEIMDEIYMPSWKRPVVLSAKTEWAIRSAAAEEAKEGHIEGAKAEGFTVTAYYGTYHDCIAVMMHDEYSGMPGEVWTETIADVNFQFSGGALTIWRN